MPLVSICIPTYKQVQYLEKCLRSVMGQGFTDYELIISDDTPGDSVKAFVFDLLKGRDFVYHHNEPALGSPGNWNNAISKATGKYIKILHHDDFFTQPYSLQHMVEQIDAEQADFLFCNTKVWYPATDFSRIHVMSHRQELKLKRSSGFLFFRNCIGAPSATLYKRDQAILFDQKLIWLVDVDFYIRYINQHPQISYLNETLICTAHETENQVTGTVIRNKDIQIREHVLLFNRIKNSVTEYGHYRSFFEYLFRNFQVKSYQELIGIAPEASQDQSFYESVFLRIGKYVFFKKLKCRLFADKYINFLKLEQF